MVKKNVNLVQLRLRLPWFSHLSSGIRSHMSEGTMQASSLKRCFSTNLFTIGLFDLLRSETEKFIWGRKYRCATGSILISIFMRISHLLVGPIFELIGCLLDQSVNSAW